MASELKIARAFVLDRRSSISSWFASVRPKMTWRRRAIARPVRVRGSEAASRATRAPGPA